MSDYFTEIFESKLSFNTEDEFNNLQSKIKSGNWVENQYNEAKMIMPNKKSWDKSNKDNSLLESQIIKPIVGMLNSIEGYGILYLGIDTNDKKGTRNNKFEKIVPILEDIIKDKPTLQGLIYQKSGGNLGIYPANSISPKIDITPVSFSNGNIFIITVKRVDNTNIYYSKITGKIYRRSNDITDALHLQEQIAFVESKRIARPTIFITPNWSDGKLCFKLSFLNKGNMIAKYISCRLHISTDPALKFEVYTKSTKAYKFKQPDGEIKLKKSDETITIQYIYDFVAGYPSLNSLYLYPELYMNLCDIYISGDNNIFSLRFDICEERGKTIQTFRYKLNDKNLKLLSSVDDSELKPYM